MQSGEAERGAVQSKATNPVVLWFMLGCEHAPRSKSVKVPLEPRQFFGGRMVQLDLEAELRCGAATGVQAPQIDGQLAGNSQDGLLALGARRSRAFGQDRQTFLNR